MTKTAVIIDDSSFIVRQLVNFFENELGLRVLATGKNGTDAITLYQKHHPDLLSLDIVMPIKTGREALDEVLAAFPDAKVLMISAVRGDAMLHCMHKGAKGYVEKPLRLDDPEFVQDFKATMRSILD